MSCRRGGNRPRASGQIVVIVALLLMVVLLLLAVAVDVGRLFITRSRLQRAAQSAADAGIGLVAERMVTLAVPRQTQAAARPPCVPDAGFGTPGASCTATPLPSRAEQWLTDDDRATLVSPEMRTVTAGEAQAYADLNLAGQEVAVSYPADYRQENPTLRVRVSILAHLRALFAAWLGGDSIDLSVEALSEVRQR